MTSVIDCHHHVHGIIVEWHNCTNGITVQMPSIPGMSDALLCNPVQAAERRATEAEEEQREVKQQLAAQIAELSAMQPTQDPSTSPQGTTAVQPPAQPQADLSASTSAATQQLQQEMLALQNALATSDASLASTQQQLALARQQVGQLGKSSSQQNNGGHATVVHLNATNEGRTAQQDALMQVATHFQVTGCQSDPWQLSEHQELLPHMYCEN